jgi:hypothetical protein
MRKALNESGQLLLEPHTLDWLQQAGQAGATWDTSPGGLFSDQSHLILTEHFKVHVSNILSKLDVSSRGGAINVAIQHKLIQ